MSKVMAVRITSSGSRVVGRRSLSGGDGRFVTRTTKYRQVRAGLGLSAG